MTPWTPNSYRQMALAARHTAETADPFSVPLANAVRSLAVVVEALVDQCEQLRNHKADA